MLDVRWSVLCKVDVSLECKLVDVVCLRHGEMVKNESIRERGFIIFFLSLK